MRIVLLILLLASSSTQAASLARADSLYALRSQGAEGDRALRTTITAAIAAYEEVAAEQPQSIEIKWKLLRALFFEGQYTGYSRPERQAWYSEAVDHAEESLAEAAELCGGNKTWKRGRRPQVARHCNTDDAAQLYLWSAVAWAQWGRASGAVDAVRHGMAAKLNDYAQRVIELDPHCEQGGGQRLLASLHARLPKIPFITGFVRRDQAIPMANAALEIDANHPGNRYIHATVLLRVAPERYAEAEATLKALANEEARGPWRVEWHNLSRRAQKWLDGRYEP